MKFHRLLRWFKFLKFLLVRLKELYSFNLNSDLENVNGLEYGENVQIIGVPLFDIISGGKVIIGKDVVLDSQNQGYHLNMYSPVKLMADEPGAIIEIGSKTRIHGSCIHARSKIVIGEGCLIASNCQIMDSSGHEMCFEAVEKRIFSRDKPRPVVIEDFVWLGTGCIIMPGVKIGRGSVVGAGSVVTRDLPSMCFAAGAPAKVISQH